MKIRVALIDNDGDYLKKIVDLLNAKYPGKMILHTYTDEKIAISELSDKKVDVLLTNELMEIDCTSFNQNCEMGYLVETNGVEFVRGKKAICKYQKIDGIYKGIVDIFTDNDILLEKKVTNGNGTKVYWTTSFSGGVGCSSFAVALAKRKAINHTVCYLNFEYNSNPELYFSGTGGVTLSEVIYALKANRTNTNMKVENALKRDESGVYFFDKPKIVLDYQEMSDSEKIQLIKILIEYIQVEYLIIDCPFAFAELSEKIWEISDKVIAINDGSEVANSKMMRTYEAIYAMQDKEIYDLKKMGVVYNKFSNKVSKVMTGIELEEYGGIVRFDHATTKQVIDGMLGTNIFEKL